MIIRQRGFTLIELLVVVAIIGILATVILASLGKARERAQIARTQSDLHQIQNITVGAQVNDNKTIMQITTSNCSHCTCPTGTDLSSLASSHTCNVNWQSAINKLSQSFSPEQVASSFYKDVWGSPFLLDENEGEQPANPCRRDTLTSVGADRIAFTADDITIALPFEHC